MAVLKETPLAKRDLYEVVAQIASDNADAAGQFFDRLHEHYQRLSEHFRDGPSPT